MVDIAETVEYAKGLPNVVFATNQVFSCASNSAQEITDAIKEKGLNRVVVAACSPRTLEPLFRETLRDAGLNEYYFEMANIREHDSWVHPMEKEEATQKAKDLIRASVARARKLEPLKEIELKVDKRVLVLGGGVAGLVSSLSIARQGYEVFLVEKEKELGGNARRLHYTIEGMDVKAYLRDLIEQVYKNPLIHVYTDAQVLDSTGYIGNFLTKVRVQGRVLEIKHGCSVMAVGAQEYRPKEYLYGQTDRVVTNLEMEGLIEERHEKIMSAQSVVIIQCVGSRNQERNYCSRICCSHSIKNALRLKEINPDIDVYILFRDIRTYGLMEDYYRLAAERHVKFIRYDLDNMPQVELVQDGSREYLMVNVLDPILGKEISLEADILGLAAAVIPQDDVESLSQLFKVSVGPDNWLKEAHVKLRPVEFSTDGVYLCGMAQYPKHLSETISHAYGAAGRVATLLTKESVRASGVVAEVDEFRCVSCGACITACTYGAIEFKDTPVGKKAVVNPILCKGDGLCNSKCPTDAIQLKHFTTDALCSQMDALIGEEEIIAAIEKAVA